jgi:hypothetical protein
MNFRTIVEIPDFGLSISHNDKCIFIGSCFAENIGNKVKSLKIPTSVNPTGIHYNPASLANTIKLALDSSRITHDTVFSANGIFNNFNFHSEFSSIDKDFAIEKMNEALSTLRKELEDAKFLFITFGTSFVYRIAESKEIVSNCHKLPENNFVRDFLSVQETVMIWRMTINELKKLNPELKIIFTVSPVRHFRDGAVGNQQSKAALILAVKDIVETTENSYYFPAYEIVNDELRDYRFYASDMIHPSEMATEYIMERFAETFFTDKTKEINKKISKVVSAANHRVFNPKTEQHRKFCETMQKQIAEIKNDFPEIDFSFEESAFKI